MERLIGKITFNYKSDGDILYAPTAKIYLSGDKCRFRLRINIQRNRKDMSFLDDEWNDFMDYAESNNIKMFNRKHWVKDVSSIPWKFWSMICSVTRNADNPLPIYYSSSLLHNAYSAYEHYNLSEVSKSLQSYIKPFALYKQLDDNENYAFIIGVIEPEMIIYKDKITEFFL